MKYNIEGAAKMIVDLKNGTFKAYSDESKERTNEAIRASFNEMLPIPNAMGKYKYRELMAALPNVFAIMEEVLDVTINDAWKSIPFYNEFVDSRNLYLGDKNDFLIEDNSWVTVNKFSGNTWDTDREKLIGRKKITIDTEWFYAYVYDDFERFLTGATTIEYLMNKLTQAFIQHADTLVAVAFNDAATNLPPEFAFAGTLTTNDVKEYILKVKTASRKNIRIIGTEMAISQLNALAEVKYSENMMNELYSSGRLGKWMGNTIVEMPQSFTPGTYNWVADNDTLLIVPETEKFIKFIDEGETRSQEKTEDENHDQTFSYQVQRKMGCAAVFGSMFAKLIIQ